MQGLRDSIHFPRSISRRSLTRGHFSNGITITTISFVMVFAHSLSIVFAIAYGVNKTKHRTVLYWNRIIGYNGRTGQRSADRAISRHRTEYTTVASPTPSEVNGEVALSANRAKMAAFGKWMQDRASLDKDERKESSIEIQANIATNILAAKTVQEMWDADEGGIPGGRDLVNLEQRIHSFDIVQGDKEDIESPLTGGTYLLVHSTCLATTPFARNNYGIEIGTEFTWNTSSPGIVTKIVKLEQLNALPADVVIRGKDQGSGKTLLQLRPVPVRATSA